MRMAGSRIRGRRWGGRGFSLPELLVVIGIFSLLIAILLPPIQSAHREARAARCAAQLKQIGYALENARNEFRYYPVWDDLGSPTRFTWIDVLLQRRMLADRRVAYCPDDARPAEINAARGAYYQVLYPGNSGKYGIDYSYGIAVPLAGAGWHWRPDFGPPDDPRPRRFEDFDRYPGQRVLAADSNWSTIYNLSGDALSGHDWSYPTLYDNCIEWRHFRHTANLLYQDGHVTRTAYDLTAATPINTASTYLWYAGEPVNLNTESKWRKNYYPYIPPVDLRTGEGGGAFPAEATPGYYTHNRLWTVVK